MGFWDVVTAPFQAAASVVESAASIVVAPIKAQFEIATGGNVKDVISGGFKSVGKNAIGVGQGSISALASVNPVFQANAVSGGKLESVGARIPLLGEPIGSYVSSETAIAKGNSDFSVYTQNARSGAILGGVALGASAAAGAIGGTSLGNVASTAGGTAVANLANRGVSAVEQLGTSIGTDAISNIFNLGGESAPSSSLSGMPSSTGAAASSGLNLSSTKLLIGAAVVIGAVYAFRKGRR